MIYENLTINQRISLKGYIQSDPGLVRYKAVWLLWGYKKAINFFLTEDLNILT